MQNARPVDVFIIGGGIIGLTTAYFLAREGVRVALADQGDLGRESSWAGAGILPGGNPKRAKNPLGRLRAKSVSLFQQLSEELREQTGIDNGYFRCGGLELRRNGDALEKQRLENLFREEQGEGLHCEVLDSKQLSKLEPALADGLPGAVYFPEMAQVRNPRHLKALIEACSRRNVQLMQGCPILDFEREGNRVSAVRTADRLIHADRFLIAAGSWSEGLLNRIGRPAGIRPIRGQIALLQLSPLPFRKILQIGSQYLVPRPDGRVLIGSTEEDVGFDKRTTAEAIRDLLSLAIQYVPCLADAPLERAWSGLRPGRIKGRPIIGCVPGFDNLFVATGHFRSGIQLSAGTALVMTELLTGKEPSVPLEAFGFESN